jgi:hypothetical protein
MKPIDCIITAIDFEMRGVFIRISWPPATDKHYVFIPSNSIGTKANIPSATAKGENDPN